MRIAVACDHAGFPLKDEVIAAIEEAGAEVIDLGTYNQEPSGLSRLCRKSSTGHFTGSG